MAIIGIFANYGISRYIGNIGRKINSPAIIADGRHQELDVYCCIAVLISVILSNLGFYFFDGLVSLGLGLIVLKVTIELLISNIKILKNRN
jgi:divalent metal cation (Fe/Co/Zn/Cd) transporter